MARGEGVIVLLSSVSPLGAIGKWQWPKSAFWIVQTEPNPRNILGVLSQNRPAFFRSRGVRDLRGSYKWSFVLWERWEERAVGEEGARITQETPLSLPGPAAHPRYTPLPDLTQPTNSWEESQAQPSFWAVDSVLLCTRGWYGLMPEMTAVVDPRHISEDCKGLGDILYTWHLCV